MAAREAPNGEDPFPEVPRRPSMRIAEFDEEDPLKIALLKFADNQSQFAQRVSELGADVRALGLATADGFMRLSNRIPSSVPPPRPESPSVVDVVEKASKSFGERVRDKARRTPGPDASGKPEEFEALAAEVCAAQMAEYERAKELKELRDKEQRDKDDAKERRERRRNFWALTISGAIAAIAAVIVSAMLASAQAHDRGFSEGVKAAPANTVLVSAPAEILSATVPVPTAPANVAPRR